VEAENCLRDCLWMVLANIVMCVCVVLSGVLNEFCTPPLLLGLPGCMHTLLY
jgi:hypothetical protein